MKKSNGPTHKLTINLVKIAYDDLVKLSISTQRTLTDTVRLGICLVKILVDVQERGDRLVVIGKDGTPIKEMEIVGI